MTSYHNPLASVCIITYNQEKYISQAIESVLMQKTNFAWEIVIGEDCSQDITAQILSKYKDKYPNQITLILQEKNVGAIRNAYEFSIPACRGKYIAFLEGDDYWTDEFKLQKQVDFLESNPDYGLVHGDVNHYFESTGNTEYSVNKKNKINVSNGSVFYELLKPNPLFIKTATTCFRKELVINYFDYNIAIKENWPLSDIALWMDITYHSKAYYFNEVFATYRLLNESASRTKDWKKKMYYHQSLFQIKLHYIKKYTCDNSIKSKLEEIYYRGLLKIAYNLGDAKSIDESVTFLKKNKHSITLKDKFLILSSKNKVLNKIIGLFNHNVK